MRLPPHRLALVLGLVLAAGGLAEVLVIGSWRGPRPVDALVAATPLALAWFPRRPAAVGFGVLVAYMLEALAFGSPRSISQFFTMTAIVMATAASRPQLWGLPVAAAAALAVALLRDPDELGIDDSIFPFVFLGGAWAVGRALYHRRRVAVAEAERADLAEAEQEAMAQAAILDERARIARELHDVVAHAVSVMVVQAVAGERMLASRSGDPAEALSAIKGTGQQALAEMRRLLGVLRSSDEGELLVPQPDLQQLRPLLDRAEEAGLQVRLIVEGEPRSLSPGVELCAYRIVQEALTNAVKHAPGAGVDVTVSYRSDGVELRVVDNGPGAKGGTSGNGHGLVGMRERVGLYGGTLRVGSRAGGGFCVDAWLPETGA